MSTTPKHPRGGQSHARKTAQRAVEQAIREHEALTVSARDR